MAQAPPAPSASRSRSPEPAPISPAVLPHEWPGPEDARVPGTGRSQSCPLMRRQRDYVAVMLAQAAVPTQLPRHNSRFFIVPPGVQLRLHVATDSPVPPVPEPPVPEPPVPELAC